MTIQIELSAEAQARLQADASTHGFAPEVYAGHLLQEFLSPGAEPQGTLTVDDFHAMLDRLAEGSDALPELRTESFTRASFYEDRV